MPQVRIVSFPRYGLPRPAHRHGRLGQINAAASLVPGQTYLFTYNVAPSNPIAFTPIAPTEDAIVNALAAWSPFANGYLGFDDVSLTSSTLTLSILANDGAENLTQGNVAQAIAQTLNNANQPIPLAGWNFSLTGAGTAGLQTPSAQQEYSSQYAQTPTPTVIDSFKAVLGLGPALPGSPSAPWYVYAAGLGLLGLIVYSSAQ